MIEATITFKFKSFTVPNFALVERKGEEELSFPLSELPAEALDALCREFRAEVFRKAKKQPPPEAG